VAAHLSNLQVRVQTSAGPAVSARPARLKD